MRVPISWLREYVDLAAELTGRDIAALLLSVGFEVEGVETVGDVTGQLVVGRVQSIKELTDFKKPIRFCEVEVGAENGAADTPGVRGIICGARNFSDGDLVIVALPGTTLPGDFTIATRETYGQISDGMLCSLRELGLGEDHSGIIVLPAGSAEVGSDAFPILGLGEEVLEVAVTPDRGYALSMRGMAREVAIAASRTFIDPADELPELAPADGTAVTAASSDSAACDLLVLRTLDNFDPAAPTPDFIKNRLAAVGVRSISLAVDVTNYVMFLLGQPLHAFDAEKISGTIHARRAKPGEKLETLDHVQRTLNEDDLVIADDSGALSLAGTMGGSTSEISAQTTRVVIEAAHFDATVVARMSRRHKLSSESSRRFERGVDRMIAPVASALAAQLLVQYGGATYSGTSAVESAPELVEIAFQPKLTDRVAGRTYDSAIAQQILIDLGCSIEDHAGEGEGATWLVKPPTWRPDLTSGIDLVEEIIRIDGYDKVPATLPTAPSGPGLSREQKLLRRVGNFLAGRGLVEVHNYPFIGEDELFALGIEGIDPRTRTIRLANPLSDEQPLLRTTLLAGLASAVNRNVSRGFGDVPLFEIASVSFASSTAVVAPKVDTSSRPSETDLAALATLVPAQPTLLGVMISGDLTTSGWWGDGIKSDWRHAIEIVVALATELGVKVDLKPAQVAPWHPGRCAEIFADGVSLGFAGELAPRNIAQTQLPTRTVAAEINLDLLIQKSASGVTAPRVWTFPIAKEDIALIVDESVAAAEVIACIMESAGELLEDVQLFDIYTGSPIPEGKKSLAFSLRLRAADRTLSANEVADVRIAVVSAVADKFLAVLRS
ncbi:MAG: phenylalanine--tRNA ligase subunit beta [Actinomycetales bacterium]|nr:phenylalanine--tRNA ligase subunit beta [Actinomycetales bacterium]